MAMANRSVRLVTERATQRTTPLALPGRFRQSGRQGPMRARIAAGRGVWPFRSRPLPAELRQELVHVALPVKAGPPDLPPSQKR